MIEKTSIEFVVRNRNGSKSGGQKIKGEIENFDWEKFKNIPNAAAFVKKAYEREARQLMRQLHENKTNVSPHHVETMENVICKVLPITKKQIETWFDERNWDVIEPLKGNAIKKQKLKEYLINLAHDDIPARDFDAAKRLALHILDVCNKNTDVTGYYLWVKLTTKATEYSELTLLDI